MKISISISLTLLIFTNLIGCQDIGAGFVECSPSYTIKGGLGGTYYYDYVLLFVFSFVISIGIVYSISKFINDMKIFFKGVNK
jgi:hypothetical protein